MGFIHRTVPRLAAIVASVCLLWGTALSAGHAAESAAVSTDHDSVTLVTDADAFTPGRPLGVGLRLKLAPGWHTYWLNPGDAGEPADLSVQATGGGVGKTADIRWPAPQRLPEGPLMSFGYTGDVLLPATLVPAAGPAGGPMRLQAEASWLACNDVCVPERGRFTLELPAGDPKPSAEAPLFAAAAARTPRPSPFPASVSPDGLLTIMCKGLDRESVAAATFFPDKAGVIDQVAPQPLSVQPGEVKLSLVPLADPGAPKSGARPAVLTAPLAGVLVLRDSRGTETALQLTAAPVAGADGARQASPVAAGTVPPPRVIAPAAVSPAGLALLRMLLFALLGGLVLNLMPCVFPVLAMKALAIARLSGAQRGAQRSSAFFYTAGVLLAFLALGGLTLALHAASDAAGWGFQFQMPVFVVGTAWLLFGIGLNLVGAFEIGGGALAGTGSGLAARGGHGGDFAAGLLAVLVATPCTAPFMGAALAGALAAPPAVGLLIFAAMGLGLALPYLLVALVPGVANAMPRPGPWMVVLRQFLAFPMFATCAWLAWVASQEGGSTAVLLLSVGLVLLALAGWLFGLSQRATMAGGARRPIRFGQFAAFAAVLVTLALLPGLARLCGPGATGAATAEGWQPFSREALAKARAAGRPVLVDMSAAWCITCLVNERIAFTSAPVRAAFRAHDVALLKGDWTNRDDAITAFLHEHGRDGVPFYMFYPARAEGRVLPQILTPGAMLRLLDEPG
ncbi:protein-disulfide reductase DsbD family protein [Rhizosaccharibacter radicis]|uniref:Thioredoxin family protein n=1 Tax=Rhizosaccharibacter radicis TaxID=2782605 RepID=A0ABT1W192_9PROT|nr:thioredoxin family protein [Acetobacteraceae bacterium KSS12]